jgi:hypothetical protein
MGFLDIFRRKPPVQDLDALADFVDQQACFLAQKGIFEYARARAGRYSPSLFREEAFVAAVDKARWQAFPLTLAMVGETVEGALRPHGGEQVGAMQTALTRMVPLPTANGFGRRNLARGAAGSCPARCRCLAASAEARH